MPHSASASCSAFAPSPANAAAPAPPFTCGLRNLRLTEPATGIVLPVGVCYPSLAPMQPQPFGPRLIAAAANASVAPGRFPVVIISHGKGGTPFGYVSIAGHLAAQGYVVAMPQHHRDNFEDNSGSESPEVLASRPRHISFIIDELTRAAGLSDHVATAHAAVVGHSMGGYTALAAAGATPRDLAGSPVPTRRDDRIRALVLLAPATPWVAHPGALAEVRVPILLLSGGRDGILHPWHLENVLRGVTAAAPVTHRVVPGAGHFSFLAPFPPEMCRPDFAPSTDPAGFDRAAFHTTLPGEIRSFLDPLLRRRSGSTSDARP